MSGVEQMLDGAQPDWPVSETAMRWSPATELEQRLRTIDLHADQLTYEQAAHVAGVDVATLRQWKSRGHLQPCGQDTDGRLLFYGIDVLRAEAKTRHRARRRFPQAC